MNTAKIWATSAFLLGVGVSISANVAHTYYPSPEVLKAAHKTTETWAPPVGAQLAAAFYPLALLLVVELLSRVEWPSTWGWQASRYGGTAIVAGVAAVVSYRHMAALLAAYGEDDLTAMIGPLAVDGLMVVASFALLALGRDGEAAPLVAEVTAPAGMESPAPAADGQGHPLPWWPLPRVEGPRSDGEQGDDGGGEAVGEPARVRAATVPGPVPEGPSTAVTVPAVAALDRGEAGTPVPEAEAQAPEAEVPVPEPVPGPDRLQVKAAEVFAEDIARGRVPGVRRIKARLNVGQPRAKAVQAYLAVLAEGSTR